MTQSQETFAEYTKPLREDTVRIRNRAEAAERDLELVAQDYQDLSNSWVNTAEKIASALGVKFQNGDDYETVIMGGIRYLLQGLKMAERERDEAQSFITATGKKTRFHRWYHDLGYLVCRVWGHNTFCSWYNDLQCSFEHCYRCERYNSDHKLPSLNLWARLVYLQIRFKIWVNRRNGRKAK